MLAELFADRLHLAAQQVLALLLLGIVVHIVADSLAHLQLCEPLALQSKRECQTLDDVERFEQLTLLRQRSHPVSSRPCRPARPAR